MKAQVYDINAKNIGEINLNPKIFDIEVKPQMIALAIRSYLANQRSAFAKTKTRSEIRGTTKKMWAQKGTGRARHSNAKAPQFVGGGVSHGPVGNQNFKIKLTKSQKDLAQKSILSKFAANKSIIVIDKLNSIQPKTREAATLMANLAKEIEVLAKSKKIGIITSASASNVKRAFGNIENLNLLSLKSLNTYDLANQNFLIFTKKAVEVLAKTK